MSTLSSIGQPAPTPTPRSVVVIVIAVDDPPRPNPNDSLSGLYGLEVHIDGLGFVRVGVCALAAGDLIMYCGWPLRVLEAPRLVAETPGFVGDLRVFCGRGHRFRDSQDRNLWCVRCEGIGGDFGGAIGNVYGGEP